MQIKKTLFLIIIVFTGCVQSPSDIVYKGKGMTDYSDNYIESPDGKIARSLRGNNNADNKESIIKKEAFDEDEKGYHIVIEGESLWIISRKYGMTVNKLIDMNKMKRPYIIKAGDRLKVGNGLLANVKPKQVVKSNDGFYIVKKGDTLSSIAENHGLKQNDLITLNGLKKPYKIFVGQKLRIGGDVVAAVKKDNEPKQMRPKKEAAIENKKNKFSWPLKGKVISSFGSKNNGLYNDGINISANKGDSFKATDDGVVAYVGNELRGYGNIILIKHDNNWISAYAHCDSISVAKGDKVKKGQTIGRVGQTGNVSSPQLYFSLRNGREAIDPMKYL
ncbi:MAG: M23 family metallopeptidase [Rickettsiales bacterium]|jgi:murein DD-endopeptidase MepM/ murein hydrolase activator NlpD|nr:M23 family metallopeptidase [Rickettsiales bacterium]